MNVRKLQIVVLVAALLIALALLLLRRSAPPTMTVESTVPAEHADALHAVAAPTTGGHAEVPTDDERAERNQAKLEPGTGENQLEHMLRSVVSANSEELKLTPAQVDRLASDYLEYQEIHAEQATRFLQETSFDPASVSLRLPPYPAEGKLLRDMFYRRLEQDFPEGKSAEIRQQLGGFFDNAFRGFGITDQTFTVTRSPEVANAFEVQWQSVVPEGQSGDGSNSDVNFAGSSGTLLLEREQLQTGEFRFLGNVVERRFPDTSGGRQK